LKWRGSAFHCALRGLIKIGDLDRGALRSSGYYVYASVRNQLGLTGFYNAPSSIETINPGHAKISSQITDAKIGKVFHGDVI
jgi:hypothetical protein